MKIKSKESLKIVGCYIFFCVLWILFSYEILHQMKQGTDLYKTLQTYKGSFFILLTSILLFKLIQNSYFKIQALDSQLQNRISELKYSQIEVNDMNNAIDKLFDISLKMLDPDKCSEKTFIKKIFRIASKLVSESDLGSAFVVREGNLKFIDSMGFNLDELNEMFTEKNLYSFSSKRVIVNRNCEKEIKKKLKNKNSSLKDVKESMYIGIYADKNIIGGFNLDISKGSNEYFTKETIYKIQMIQNISNKFYNLKKASDYRFEMQNDVVQSFITALEFHDQYTRGHSESVGSYSVKLGNSLNLDEKQLDELYWAALLHDIGKIIIPSETLNKEGELTDAEYEIVKNHSKVGAEIVRNSSSLKEVSQYILYHHERWDGKGYPEGLKGDEIPLISQIISVADTWHAMTSERPYKKKLSNDEAIDELIRNRGTQLSPKVVSVFMKNKNYFTS
ncbi:HD-GYP domain-containing protein [Psychrilyobacter atlanticus]|uniref:HD-GYP domain-containing protein n=1 Tax=Psychrilyobacter atlanticus TaxID=271091 RepID=UPI00040BFC86|nr:HD-GYP domain-containing protein [Psychrilyobacter atlanticus]